MRNMWAGGLALMGVMIAVSPAAAQIELNDGGRSAYFFPEEWDGNELTAEGYVYVIDWSTGSDGWATFHFDSQSGDVQVWEEGLADAPGGTRRYYGGVACHDHSAQNRRFGEVVKKAFSNIGQGLAATAWRCIGQGAGCLVESVAISAWSPIVWDIGWYAWTCYRP